MEEWSTFTDDQLIEYNAIALFLYTPLCGTCKVAERMLTVAEELTPTVSVKKINLNYAPELAGSWEIQSVPCLLLFKNGELIKRIFAFHSVDYVYKELTKLT